MEKPYVFWSTGRGCLTGLLLVALAIALVVLGIALDLDAVPLLAVCLPVLAPLAWLSVRIDRRGGRG